MFIPVQRGRISISHEQHQKHRIIYPVDPHDALIPESERHHSIIQEAKEANTKRCIKHTRTAEGMEFQMDIEPRVSDDKGADKRDGFILEEDEVYADPYVGRYLRSEGIVQHEQRFQRGELNGYKPDDATDEDIEPETTPPENFSPVCGEIYRSSFPRVENFSFLSKLGLRSILMLIPEEYPSENTQFVEENGIQLFQVGMSGNKEPFVHLPDDILSRALEIAINPANHPLLIHCNRGKHRTGCLVGCIRRLQNWSLTMIFEEYRRFAAPKARPLDLQFIEMYNEEEVAELAQRNGWLELTW